MSNRRLLSICPTDISQRGDSCIMSGKVREDSVTSDTNTREVSAFVRNLRHGVKLIQIRIRRKNL